MQLITEAKCCCCDTVFQIGATGTLTQAFNPKDADIITEKEWYLGEDRSKSGFHYCPIHYPLMVSQEGEFEVIR